MPGSSGVYARLPAAWGHREDSVLVPIPARPMVDESALGHVLKQEIVIAARAQVTKMRKSFKTFIIMHVKTLSNLRCMAKASYLKVWLVNVLKNPLHWSSKDGYFPFKFSCSY